MRKGSRNVCAKRGGLREEGKEKEEHHRKCICVVSN